jgi:hypothetical protein
MSRDQRRGVSGASAPTRQPTRPVCTSTASVSSAPPASRSAMPFVRLVPAPTSIPPMAQMTSRPNAIVNARPAMMYAVSRRRGRSAASRA